MKDFYKFCLAAFAVIVFIFKLPGLWAEVALIIYAAIGILGNSKLIAGFEIFTPIIAIIIFYHRPDLALVCLVISAFLAVWGIVNLYQGLKKNN